MDDILIIGLPKALRARVEGQIVRHGARATSLLADIGKEGRLRITPHPDQAIHELRAFLDARAEWKDVHILALPYAPIPQALLEELITVQEFVGKVTRASAGKDNWPQSPQSRPTGDFLNAVFRCLQNCLFPSTEALPSEHFLALAADFDRMLLTSGALDLCDTVAPHRRSFLIDGANALKEFVLSAGSVGRVDEFFEERGLKFAQTGGIEATFELYRDGQRVYKHTCCTHLKKGDATTPQVAARLYFHAFTFEDVPRVAILYAGPHPDVDCTRTYRLSN